MEKAVATDQDQGDRSVQHQRYYWRDIAISRLDYECNRLITTANEARLEVGRLRLLTPLTGNARK